ncbi:hypothetical protein [Bacillus sp. 196mf]|uniref:hypothetical protein n=1 Tax=Bacillus sp. 196mf TaxID=1761754 RepID=UPI000D7CBBC7|nr:hypothetical protein [Bacillus sp. 196mf]PYE87809.1 hypothetical protein ATL10_10591 [Bacillus sp. 196mf]
MKKFIPKVLTTAALIGLSGSPIVGSPLTAHAGAIEGKEKTKDEKKEKEKREKVIKELDAYHKELIDSKLVTAEEAVKIGEELIRIEADMKEKKISLEGAEKRFKNIKEENKEREKKAEKEKEKRNQ